jgi:hypothetical protein
MSTTCIGLKKLNLFIKMDSQNQYAIDNLFRGLKEETDYKRFCKTLIEEAKSPFKLMNPELLTPETCYDAVESDPENMLYVPKKFLTSEFILHFIRKDVKIVKYLDISQLDEQMLWCIVVEDPMVLKDRMNSLEEKMLASMITINQDLYKFILNPTNSLTYLYEFLVENKAKKGRSIAFGAPPPKGLFAGFAAASGFSAPATVSFGASGFSAPATVSFGASGFGTQSTKTARRLQ